MLAFAAQGRGGLVGLGGFLQDHKGNLNQLFPIFLQFPVGLDYIIIRSGWWALMRDYPSVTL